MTGRGVAFTMAQALAVALAFLFSATVAQAGEHLILKFNKTEGAYPLSGLTSDAAGNLFGMTVGGGEKNCGTVFELSPGSGGQWTETLLFSFQGCRFEALVPRGTMAIDQEGNLYGIQVGYSDSGQIFELVKGAKDAWAYRVLYVFGSSGSSEGTPNTDLTWDSAGNLYGTTSAEFGTINGEVFELSPQPNGNWKESVLYTFPAPNGVGFPVAGVTFDGNGNLYGPTYYGTTHQGGAVYELSPQANGPWALTVVFNFTGNEGSELNSRLVFDSGGNLYGTATDPTHGEVFELSHASGSAWKETTLHVFTSGSDGSYPQGTLVFDASGSLYGTTAGGGLGCNGSLCGVVYQLTPQSGGTWKETILHHFESAEDGSQPQAGLLLDNAGHLYGTTEYGGGRYGYGTVFQITP
jgi:uncharacterized repeat protein (TIGR03803 family)